MDNKDQRNASVPLGTFNEDGASDASENTDLYVQGADQDVPAEPTSSADFARARPGRKRVRTLLGVPLADVGDPARVQRSDSISEAIQHMLDEQASVALEVDERESDPGAVLSEADLNEMAEIPRSGVLSVGPNPEEPINDDAPTKTRIPLLVPSQYVEAQELDRSQVQSTTSEIELEPLPMEDDDRPTRERVDEEALTGRLAGGAAAAGSTAAESDNAPPPATSQTSTAADGGEAAPASPRTLTATAPAAAAGAAAARAATANGASRTAGPATGRTPAQQPVSSLAPREVARRQPAARDAGAGVGLLMVAAMALIAAGGWWLTSGSFSRSRDEANARGAATSAAASQPVAPQGESAMALETPPGQLPPGQATQASDALAAQQADAQSADQGNPLKSSKNLTATSRAFGPKTAKKAPKLVPTKGGGMPEAPSRAEVLQRMESVRPAVRACATGLSGVADLDITIAHSGKVTHVLVGGDFAGTTQGSCIARAVREAKFPSFKQERFRLLFPYPI